MTARLGCSLGSARLAAVVVKWLMKRRHPLHLKEEEASGHEVVPTYAEKRASL